MNKEFSGFDEMVEALEENEDMVECKECFDLFPKVECERAEVGYICPVCKGLRTAPLQTSFVDPYDCYTQEFPEVKDYNPDSVVEYEKEPDLGDALNDLIKDEYEAIDGYEVADEIVQHAAIDADQKDEILDTLDHIKEEEEEHIEELKELCPECDPEESEKPEVEEPEKPEAEPEKLEEAAEEEEVEEIPEEDIPEEEAEDSEENENEEVSDLDSAYEAALEIANETGVGQVFGYAKKDTEEFVAIEPFEVDDPDAVEDDLMAVYDDVAYAYVAYPEKNLEEALFESVQLNEASFLTNLFTKENQTLDKVFTHGYIVAITGDNAKEYRVEDGFANAEKLAAKLSQSGNTVELKGKKLTSSELTELPDLLQSQIGKTDYLIARYKNGKPTMVDNAKALAKAIKTSVKAQKKIDKYSVSSGEPKEDSVKLNTTTMNLIDKLFVNGYAVVKAATEEGKPSSYSKNMKTYLEALAVARDLANQEDQPTVYIFSKAVTAEDLNIPNAKKVLAAIEKIISRDLDVEVLGKFGAAGEVSGGPICLAAIWKGKRVIDPMTNLTKFISKVNTITNLMTYEEDEEEEDIVPDDDSTETSETSETPEAADTTTEETADTADSEEKSEETKSEEATDDAADDTNQEAHTEESDDETFNPADIFAEPEETSKEPAKGPAETAESEPETKSTASTKLSDIDDERLANIYQRLTKQRLPTKNTGRRKAQLDNIRNLLRSIGESYDGEVSSDELVEALQSEADALKTLKNTETALKSAANGIKNMTSAMREEYHRYANPAELAAMEDIEELIIKALSKLYDDIAAWGYEAAEIDTQSFMCQEDETCFQYMLEFNDLDPDELDDLASQIEMQLKNEISVYKPVPEIRELSVSVALPDYDLADEEDEAEGITKASFLFYVDFARKLF